MPNTIYDKDWDEGRQLQVSSRKVNLPLGHDHPHYPNKSESAMLRKLMQDSKCSEEEVRARKGNRQKLAMAAKEPEQQGNTDRRQLKIKRRARSLAKAECIPIWEAQARAGLDLKRQERNRLDY